MVGSLWFLCWLAVAAPHHARSRSHFHPPSTLFEYSLVEYSSCDNGKLWVMSSQHVILPSIDGRALTFRMASPLPTEDERLRCGLYNSRTTSPSSLLSTFRGFLPSDAVPLRCGWLEVCVVSTDFINACKSTSSGGARTGIFDRLTIFAGLCVVWSGDESRINSLTITSESLSDNFTLKSMGGNVRFINFHLV